MTSISRFKEDFSSLTGFYFYDDNNELQFLIHYISEKNIPNVLKDNFLISDRLLDGQKIKDIFEGF